MGIVPQQWHPDYTSLNDKLTVAHRNSLIRMINWRREEANAKQKQQQANYENKEKK